MLTRCIIIAVRLFFSLQAGRRNRGGGGGPPGGGGDGKCCRLLDCFHGGRIMSGQADSATEPLVFVTSTAAAAQAVELRQIGQQSRRFQKSCDLNFQI